MKLEGIHHITAITGDAPGNVDFYARVLGLRLVKKTVNQDDPTVYHLFYADEKGSAGTDLTFFEYPGATPGPRRRGHGPHDRLAGREPGGDRLLGGAARRRGRRDRARRRGACASPIPRASAHELVVDESGDDPLMAEHPEIPAEHALRGFDTVRAYSARPDASRALLRGGARLRAGAATAGRCAVISAAAATPTTIRPSPRACRAPGPSITWPGPRRWRITRPGGSGSKQAGAPVTPVIDRFYFRSIYFREPSGVLFEIATLGPGFATDEDPEHLGERLSLPPNYERYRDQVERTLTPIENPRERWAERRVGACAS